MERHRRNLLKGGLESLSQKDLSNNRPGRLLNKLRVPFQHPLARSVATQSSLAFFIFFFHLGKQRTVFAHQHPEKPQALMGFWQGDRGKRIFSLQSRIRKPLLPASLGPFLLEIESYMEPTKGVTVFYFTCVCGVYKYAFSHVCRCTCT